MLERAAMIRVCVRVAGGKEVTEQAQEIILLPAAPSLTSYCIMVAAERILPSSSLPSTLHNNTQEKSTSPFLFTTASNPTSTMLRP